MVRKSWFLMWVLMMVGSVQAQSPVTDKAEILEAMLKMHDHYRSVKQNLTVQMVMQVMQNGKLVAEQPFTCQYKGKAFSIQNEHWESLASEDGNILLNKKERTIYYSDRPLPQLQQNDLLQSIDQLKALVEHTERMQMTHMGDRIQYEFWPEQDQYQYVRLEQNKTTMGLTAITFRKVAQPSVPAAATDAVDVTLQILSEEKKTDESAFDGTRYLTVKDNKLSVNAKYSGYEIIRY